VGLDAENIPHRRIEEMAEHYIKEVRRVQPEGPYLVGGWSMGGLVAFEMAQQLQMQNQKVALLALIDSIAPHSTVNVSQVDELALLESFAQDIGLTINGLTFSPEELRRLKPDEQLDQLLQQLKIEGLLPPDLELSQLRHFFNIFKTNVRAMLTYVPRPVASRIALFVAEEPLTNRAYDPVSEWGRLATAGMDVHSVPGNHFTIIREPQVKTLAERLCESLNSLSMVNV
jgi:thioesterase domain-containing protein